MNTLFGLMGFSVILTIAISMILPMIVTQPPAFSQPIACKVGEDCFIQNYVDLDPSEKWHDHRCGPLTYDGHKGTDFRLRNLVQMREGVKVLAAADGEVLRLRDGMPDASIRDANAPNVKGTECGNGLVIKHNGGHETQYCHLKQGSLTVSPQQEVKRGDVLGEVGLSGNTEFPHLHFSLRNKDGEVIDPFAGKMKSSDCDEKGRHGHFWQPSAKKAMPYIETALLGYGFTDARPTDAGVRNGKFTAQTISTKADPFIFWVDLMGLKKGDTLIIQLMGPDNVALVNHSRVMKGNKAQQFQFIGKRLTEKSWPEGTYKAVLRVQRNKVAVIDKTMQIDVIETNLPEKTD